MNTAFGHNLDRRSDNDASPKHEDLGLFKGELCQLQVELTPQIKHNSRTDVLVDGFIHGGAEVVIAFAGRRRLLFGPFKSRLGGAQAKHIKSLKEQGEKATDASLRLKDVRLPVLIEGSWRITFALDEEGFQQKVRQFVAARWIYATDSGELKNFGSRPDHIGLS